MKNFTLMPASDLPLESVCSSFIFHKFPILLTQIKNIRFIKNFGITCTSEI